MDYTGKAGTGKRYLDDNGNFMPISSLPREKQVEIQENSRLVSKMQMDARLKKQGIESAEITNENGNMAEKMLKIIEHQGRVIERLEGKFNNIDVPSKDVMEDKQEEVEVKLTPKEKLMAEAMDLGLVVDDKMTMKTIQNLIDEESMEIVESDDDDVDEDSDL